MKIPVLPKQFVPERTPSLKKEIFFILCVELTDFFTNGQSFTQKLNREKKTTSDYESAVGEG